MGNLSTAKAITFLDTETTHLDPEKGTILSISIVTDWNDGKDGNQSVWTTKIKPREIELKYASEEALKICGYNEKDWEDAPYFEDVAEEIAKRIKYGPIVGHNVQFDINHIKACFLRRGWEEQKIGEKYGSGNKKISIGYPIIDTCALSYIFLPTEKQNLNILREHLNITQEGAHTPDKDALDCRKLFYYILDNTTR